MITNNYLRKLFEYDDRDIILCQILEYVRVKDSTFFYKISLEPQEELLSEEERYFLVCLAVLVKYKSSTYPGWMDKKHLMYDAPVFYNKKHITQQQMQELVINAPDAFKKHNLYFLLEGLERR